MMQTGTFQEVRREYRWSPRRTFLTIVGGCSVFWLLVAYALSRLF